MIIDSHCHLHDPAFADVRGTVIRATEHDVWGVVAVGCDAATNERTLQAALDNGKGVWPAFGFHGCCSSTDSSGKTNQGGPPCFTENRSVQLRWPAPS